jgi:hypothetical protein
VECLLAPSAKQPRGLTCPSTSRSGRWTSASRLRGVAGRVCPPAASHCSIAPSDLPRGDGCSPAEPGWAVSSGRARSVGLAAVGRSGYAAGHTETRTGWTGRQGPTAKWGKYPLLFQRPIGYAESLGIRDANTSHEVVYGDRIHGRRGPQTILSVFISVAYTLGLRAIRPARCAVCRSRQVIIDGAGFDSRC